MRNMVDPHYALARKLGPGMSLANMRENGVTKVDVTCGCGHEAVVDVSELPGTVCVPDLPGRMRCSACGRVWLTPSAQPMRRMDAASAMGPFQGGREFR